MTFLKLLLVSCLFLTGCSINQPPVIDCGNGYYVNPPLACPNEGLSK